MEIGTGQSEGGGRGPAVGHQHGEQGMEVGLGDECCPRTDGLVRKVNIKIAGSNLKEVEVGVQRLRLVYRPAEKE